jgi:hypothetical protein
MVEKIWTKDVWRAKIGVWKALRLICKIPGALVTRIYNLEQRGGIYMCKIEWSWADL